MESVALKSLLAGMGVVPRTPTLKSPFSMRGCSAERSASSMSISTRPVPLGSSTFATSVMMPVTGSLR